MYTLMQGDSFELPFCIHCGEVLIDSEMVSVVEIMIGNLRKTFPGEIWCDPEKRWIFPLSQEETFELPPCILPCQIRIKFSDEEGTATGINGLHINVTQNEIRSIL